MNFSPRALLTTWRRDVALRGGLTSAAVTAIVLTLLSATVWFFLQQRLENRIEHSLIERHEISISNTMVMSDEERSIVQEFRRALPIRDEGVFAWLDHSGAVTSSSISGVDCRDGFYDGWVNLDKPEQGEGKSLPMFSARPEGESVQDRFRFLARERTQGCLIFGRSMYEVDALRTSTLGLLLWLVPLCLLPSLLFSLKQSFTLRRRLHRMGSAVQALSKGDLDARMPVEGDDDIDRLAQTANSSFDRLQESVSTMQQLTSVMAHDLRAPLSRIAIPLDEAVRANDAGQPAVESLGKVKEGLTEVRTVFDALLRITQVESGKRRAQFTDIDLPSVAEGLFEIYEAVVEDEERLVEFEVSGQGKGIIHGDTDLIRQAVVNLIENSIRYTPKGSLIRICVLCDPLGPELIIADNGSGLPAEERPRVLRRLYRYEGSTGGTSGHGLGLSLVKAVVDLHDATITLEDAGPGLLVRIKFPVVGESPS